MSDLAGIVRSDARFLLPAPVRTVRLHGSAAEHREAFEAVGLEIVERGGDVVHGLAADAREILAARPPAVILEGRAVARRVRRAGLAAGAHLPLPDLERTQVVLPLGQARAARYAVSAWGGRPDARRALRNRLAPLLLSAGIGPPGRARLTVGARERGPSFLLAAAAELGVPGDGELYWSPGASDLLSRGVLHVLAPGNAAPGWVVKFARVPGASAAFDRDERGFAVATAAGPVVAAHAPRLLGRFEAGGVPASVETAAPGERLVSLLESTDPRRDKVAAIDAIAGWLVEAARATAVPGTLGPELERLRVAVLPRWPAPEGLLTGLDALPGVLVHNDLGSWNLLVSGAGFTAVDWEGAVRHGLPLWDLVYFLAHAMIVLERVAADAAPAAIADLFAGRSPGSPHALAWVRRMVEALAIPRELVGPLALTSWLHHGLSAEQRTAAVRREGGEPSGGLTRLPRLVAERWLADPALGARWSAWA